jgi:hypothetical protein
MGGKFDRGENSMFIVGESEALIYPTGGCADPRNACAYTESEGTRRIHVVIYPKRIA